MKAWHRGLLLAVLAAGGARAGDWADDWDSPEPGGGDWNGGWAENGGIRWSGYLETTGLLVLPRARSGDDALVGLSSIVRLRARFEPDPDLSVVLEAELRDLRGAADPRTRWLALGAEDVPPADSRAGDAARSIDLDYLYGAASFGPLDLRVGRQPLAWGTAYAFNPTDLANPDSLADFAGIEPPGIAAVTASLTPGASWGVEGYVGFEDRTRRATAGRGIASADQLPFGVRARAFAGVWDIGAGFVRAVEGVAGPDGNLALRVEERVTAEVAGSIGATVVYAESALRTGRDAGRLSRALDAALGLRVDPFDHILLQAEYHRRGRGAARPEDYAPADRLTGRLAARDYLVAVGTASMARDTLRLQLAALRNLNDRSMVLIPELEYEWRPDLLVGLGASLFAGPEASEFDGRVNGLDLGRPQLFVTATWYF